MFFYVLNTWYETTDFHKCDCFGNTRIWFFRWGIVRLENASSLENLSVCPRAQTWVLRWQVNQFRMPLVCKCKQDHHCWVNVFKAGIGGTFENKLWNGAHTTILWDRFCNFMYLRWCVCVQSKYLDETLRTISGDIEWSYCAICLCVQY